MRNRIFVSRTALFSVVVAAFVLLPSAAYSQVTNNNSSSSSSTDNNNNSTQQSGVFIDADGVLRNKYFTDPGGQLTRERILAAKSTLGKVSAFSKLRKISLNRLEEAVVEHQGVITDEMRTLAGLQRVQYVFYYPETKDIVIAGPAEGWITNVTGRIVGMTTGRPVVQLQDLVVGLRAFAPNGKSPSFIGCSIDPTEEGLAAYKQFLNTVGGNVKPGDTQELAQALRTKMGLQNISVNGVSPDTRFAQVMVEADYRMKLIGIGLEKPPVKLTTYVDRVNPAEVGRNASQRWFFVPDYECVRVSNDKLAMELVGEGVKLVGENEVFSESGQRRSISNVNKASQAFEMGFTKAYPQLADRVPLYADLRNLIDISVAAAFIQQQDLYGKAGWTMKFLGDEKMFSVETYAIPKTVETVVNAIWKGRTLMTPVSGGVQIHPKKALEPGNLLSDEKGNVAKTREETKINLAKGQWWWD